MKMAPWRRRAEEQEMGEEPAPAVLRLIEKATNSTAHEVDPHLLRAISLTIRYSDDEVRAAVQFLMFQMRKSHSQVRYLAVLIIDELFMRSKLFRSLLVIHFDQFLSLSVGFRRNMPLPPPLSIASNLQKMSIELLEKWNASFGIYYRQLRLGFEYLKNTLRYQFPNRIENAARLQQERREREIRTQQILLNKFENLKENFPSIKSEIQSTIDEAEECLEIFNEKEVFYPHKFIEEEELEEFQSLALRKIRLESLKEGQKVQENSDNKAIFDALRELFKLLVLKHLTLIREWISVLIRVELSDNRFRETALKELIDIQKHIHSVRNRCVQLGCVLNDPSNEEEEDFWEEGKIEDCTLEKSSRYKSLVQNPVDAPTMGKDKNATPLGENNLFDNSGSSSPRSRLLAEAPVLTWGPFLDNWGSRRDVLANQRGLELESHWGRVDFDAVIPAEKIAELSVHHTVYEEEQVEIQPCLAPLRKGGLCQRRDLRICPFHGPIIPRDSNGNPLGESLSNKGKTEKISSITTNGQSDGMCVGESLKLSKLSVEQVAKQAVKNARERERNDKLLKRAKLAKVREHNDMVLREAAIASTSYSEASGEYREALQENQNEPKKKKPTLSSMLKKKFTPKDRLNQRLLNTRVTDSAIRQVMQGEDLNYREAFPNQW
ncbi:UV-stimulated scaffold protein A homolog isoform X1 [Curcuma longa]|uniref:UV-stimulated scaffold protein A homolog isoform X1 n=1 Tax=Curcuma longa TaxID=136217 RepID=UPI003D9EFBFF